MPQFNKMFDGNVLNNPLREEYTSWYLDAAPLVGQKGGNGAIVDDISLKNCSANFMFTSYTIKKRLNYLKMFYKDLTVVPEAVVPDVQPDDLTDVQNALDQFIDKGKRSGNLNEPQILHLLDYYPVFYDSFKEIKNDGQEEEQADVDSAILVDEDDDDFIGQDQNNIYNEIKKLVSSVVREFSKESSGEINKETFSSLSQAVLINENVEEVVSVSIADVEQKCLQLMNAGPVLKPEVPLAFGPDSLDALNDSFCRAVIKETIPMSTIKDSLIFLFGTKIAQKYSQHGDNDIRQEVHSYTTLFNEFLDTCDFDVNVLCPPVSPGPGPGPGPNILTRQQLDIKEGQIENQKNASRKFRMSTLLSILYKFTYNFGVSIGNNAEGYSFLLRFSLDSFLLMKDNSFNTGKKIIEKLKEAYNQLGLDFDKGFAPRTVTYNANKEGLPNKEGNAQEDYYVFSFIQALMVKLYFTYSIMINNSKVFNFLFTSAIPYLFFDVDSGAANADGKTAYVLTKEIINFVMNTSYDLQVNLTNDEFAKFRIFYSAMTICALLYSDDLLKETLYHVYFKKYGIALQYLPMIGQDCGGGNGDKYSKDSFDPNGSEIKTEVVAVAKDLTVEENDPGSLRDLHLPENSLIETYEVFYYPYLLDVKKKLVEPGFLKSKKKILALLDYPIPLCTNSLTCLFLLTVDQGQRAPLKGTQYKQSCFDNIINPLLQWFWEEYCSPEMEYQLRTSIKYKNIFNLIKTGKPDDLKLKMTRLERQGIIKVLQELLYNYLLGSNGILIDQVPGEMLSLDLVQYTKLKRSGVFQTKTSVYFSYSITELQIITESFMKKLPEAEKTTKKTPAEWIQWSGGEGLIRDDILPNRPGVTGQQLMKSFMSEILKGMASNYSYFKKKDLEQQGLNELFTKKRSLPELYLLVYEKIEAVNIENVNVTKTSLLSKRVGGYLLDSTNLWNDLTSAIDVASPYEMFFTAFYNLFYENNERTIENAFVMDPTIPKQIHNLMVYYLKSGDTSFINEINRRISVDQRLRKNIRKLIDNKDLGKSIFGIYKSKLLGEINISRLRRENPVLVDKFLKTLLSEDEEEVVDKDLVDRGIDSSYVKKIKDQRAAERAAERAALAKRAKEAKRGGNGARFDDFYDHDDTIHLDGIVDLESDSLDQ